jgi:hypothetical protein
MMRRGSLAAVLCERLGAAVKLAEQKCTIAPYLTAMP